MFVSSDYSNQYLTCLLNLSAFSRNCFGRANEKSSWNQSIAFFLESVFALMSGWPFFGKLGSEALKPVFLLKLSLSSGIGIILSRNFFSKRSAFVKSINKHSSFLPLLPSHLLLPPRSSPEPSAFPESFS